MEFTLTASTTKLFSPTLNCHQIEIGDTVKATDPNSCSAPDWDDMRRQLAGKRMELEWLGYDETSEMDEYLVVMGLADDYDLSLIHI